MRIQVINGPNLNLLGQREPEIYGKQSLNDLATFLISHFPNIEFDFLQSNHEGEIIDCIQMCHQKQTAIVINPGGYSHSSVAIHDALKMTNVAKMEVHITNIHQREHFRQHSLTAMACNGVIAGLGFNGYQLAVEGLILLSKGS